MASNIISVYTPPISKQKTPLFSSSNSSFFTNTSSRSFNLIKSQRSVSSNTQKGKRFSCNCMFGLGVPELVVIAGVASLVFGPKKLPEVGRSIGKTFKSFQQAAKEFETELRKDPEQFEESQLAVNEIVEKEN
ncbi:sec-independent protein translocase protein TATA, chloroplastic-like [Rutidosis leptorrhynchoides]|uniref:sec-independent protein translocase protein TATA, chloroplastic-like n=1 Tax=Rutidosis leptorrhynchoides TaxID=125765 RepID=UPI003A995DEC